MDYKEAMDYINGTQKFGSNLGLNRIKMLLQHMGNPQKKLKFIHVAGTNGKGSTVTFLSSILIEAGYKVGIFTSPSIQRFSERIKVNNTEIPEDSIAGISELIKEKVDLILQNDKSNPTEFEIVTAMAFQYFFDQNCDIVVLEVGLGGRLDSTNIIDTPEVAVITTINYDHMDILGDTLSKITFEKAGIIKKNCDVVLYPQEIESEKVIEYECEEVGATLHRVDFSTILTHSINIFSMQKFDFKGYKALEISMLGNHQIKNAAVAVSSIEILIGKGYEINEVAIRNGLVKARWPGRLEVVNKSPLFLIDGAHNPQGAITLADNLKSLFPDKKITFILGVLADKDYKSMIEVVIPLAHRFITVTPKNSRALNSKDLEAFLKSYGMEVIGVGESHEAIRISLELALKDEIICAFGSLYYIGEVREYFGLI